VLPVEHESEIDLLAGVALIAHAQAASACRGGYRVHAHANTPEQRREESAAWVGKRQPCVVARGLRLPAARREGTSGLDQSVSSDPQSLGAQVTFVGPVWLDRVRVEVGETRFGHDLRARLRARDEFVRGLGLDPASPRLHWQLRDLQPRRLEQTMAAEGGVLTRIVNGFEGTVRVRREPNGERFMEVRSPDRFVVGPAPRDVEAFDGKHVQLQVDQRRVRVIAIDRDRGLSR
jgi:hypothetical protein